MGLSEFRSGKGSKKGKTRNFSLLRQVKIRRNPSLSVSFDRTPTQAGANETITSTGSQTYTVPRGVDTVNITMYGGGGGGGLAASGRSGTTKGGGGGGGSRLVLTLNEVPSGTVLTFNVGAGGDKATSASGNSDDGGNTTLSYGGVDYVAGGGEGNRSGSIGLGGKDGTGGAGDCDGGSTCTATAGNNGTAYNTGGSTTPGGAALGDSAGAGGDGSNNASSQNAEDGSDGKVIIS
jgi:hypothetical protein